MVDYKSRDLVYDLVLKVNEINRKIEYLKDNTIIFKYVEEIIPSENNIVLFKPFELSKGLYKIDIKTVFINYHPYYRESGIILGLYNNEELLTTCNFSWHGNVNGDEKVSACQDIFIKYILDVSKNTTYHLSIKPLEIKNCEMVKNDKMRSTLLTIF
jgi:hypothetical protein